MQLIRILAIVLLGIAALTALIAAPGWAITYRRTRANAKAQTVGSDGGAFIPLLEVDAGVDHYIRTVRTAALACLDGIDAALVAFEQAGSRHYGDDYVQPDKLPGVPIRTHGTPGDLLKATRVALIRMRVGILEPLQAYRPGNTPTDLMHLRGLRELLAAEEEPALA